MTRPSSPFGGRRSCCLARYLWVSARRRRTPRAIPRGRSRSSVPFAPAGPTDTMARLIAQKLSDSLGKQFYVENHPGAGGNLGMAMVANAAPDGYTLLLVSSSVVVNPSLYEKGPVRRLQESCAGDACRFEPEHSGRASVGAGERRSRSSSPMCRPIPAK